MNHAQHAPTTPRPPVGSRASGPRRRIAGVSLAAVALLPIGACSSEDVADRLSERVAEAAGEGVDVDIDSESGSFSVSGEDGSFSTSTGGDLPDGFPEDVPLPADHTVLMSSTSSTGGEAGHFVQLEAPGDPEAVFDDLSDRFEGDGWEVLTTTTSDYGDGPTSNAMFSRDDLTVSINVYTGDEDGRVAIGYTVATGAG